MPKQLPPGCGTIADVQLNSAGSRVSYIGTDKPGTLFVWDVEGDQVQQVDLDDNKTFVSHYWDPTDERVGFLQSYHFNMDTAACLPNRGQEQDWRGCVRGGVHVRDTRGRHPSSVQL